MFQVNQHPLPQLINRHFSRKTLNGLKKLRIAIINSMAIPAFEGDKYFTGTGYAVVIYGTQMILTLTEIIKISLFTIEDLDRWLLFRDMD